MYSFCSLSSLAAGWFAALQSTLTICAMAPGAGLCEPYEVQFLQCFCEFDGVFFLVLGFRLRGSLWGWLEAICAQTCVVSCAATSLQPVQPTRWPAPHRPLFLLPFGAKVGRGLPPPIRSPNGCTDPPLVRVGPQQPLPCAILVMMCGSHCPTWHCTKLLQECQSWCSSTYAAPVPVLQMMTMEQNAFPSPRAILLVKCFSSSAIV